MFLKDSPVTDRGHRLGYHLRASPHVFKTKVEREPEFTIRAVEPLNRGIPVSSYPSTLHVRRLASWTVLSRERLD